jgi:hypothetical protein
MCSLKQALAHEAALPPDERLIALINVAGLQMMQALILSREHVL